jgi:hypothetical protein
MLPLQLRQAEAFQSESSFKTYHSMLQGLWRQGLLQREALGQQQPVKDLKDDPVYMAMYKKWVGFEVCFGGGVDCLWAWGARRALGGRLLGSRTHRSSQQLRPPPRAEAGAQPCRGAAAALPANETAEPNHSLQTSHPGKQQTNPRCAAQWAQKRGPLPLGRDPQDKSIETTFKEDDLLKMGMAAMASKEPMLLRDWCMMLLQALTIGRGEDVRERRMNELHSPIYIDTIGGRWRFPMVCQRLVSMGVDGRNAFKRACRGARARPLCVATRARTRACRGARTRARTRARTPPPHTHTQHRNRAV